MKKIARITTQKRNKERYNIFISEDDKEYYGFSVNEAILIQYALRKGMELPENFLDDLLQQNTLYEAYTQAIHYLSYRMRTKKEIRDHLIKKEVEPMQADEVLARLDEEKLIDDLEFAKMFVRTRVNTSDKGPGFIKRELLGKGVTEQIISQALELYTFGDQLEKALQFTMKKNRQQVRESHTQKKQRIQAALMQRGFSTDVIKEAIVELEEEKNEDVELEAMQQQADKLLRKYSRTHEGYELKQKLKEGLYRKGFSMDTIRDYLDNNLE